MTLPPRRRQGRLLGGVCAGAARFWHLDVTLLRVALLLLCLAWGSGVLLYLAAWLLMPPEGHRRRVGFRNSPSGNFNEVKGDLAQALQQLSLAWQQRKSSAPRFVSSNRQWLALGLLSFGAAVLLASFGAWIWLTPARALGIASVGLGTTLFLTAMDRKTKGNTHATKLERTRTIHGERHRR